MLNQSIIPFMSSVSCLFDTTGAGELGDHEKRLSTLVRSWGFVMHTIPGDGNCCFLSIASSLLHQRFLLEEKYPAIVSKLQLNVATVKEIALQLRDEAVKEWTMNASEITKDSFQVSTVLKLKQHNSKKPHISLVHSPTQ
jgi:hypothetical protein